MTFTTSLKEEISQNSNSPIEARFEIEGFIKSNSKIDNQIIITLENAAVARRIYKDIKTVYNISPLITIRNQKRFRIKQIYILTIKDKVDIIKKDINLEKTNSIAANNEEKIAFITGVFLAIGNISNPQTSGYHLEFICNNEKFAKYLMQLINSFNFTSKIIKRGYKYIVYIKAAEQISDLIKMFKASSALFFFEDIRIYRDHKNMVNRLNNCELSNQIKTITTGQKQLDTINFIKQNNLTDILDEKTKIVMEAREKYPESSLNELSEIISLEYNYKIGKSGVNHHFIKINDLVKRYRSNNENK